MDKIAANNHIVILRKEAKKAMLHVAGNFTRKVAGLKKEKEKLDSIKDKNQIDKIDERITRLLDEYRSVKKLDSYVIAKRATLKPDLEHWKKMIGDSKATSDEKLIARVITKKTVLKQVDKFRADHKDCDEWLEEYFEYREKKQEFSNLKRGKKFKPNQRSKDWRVRRQKH